MAFDYRKYEYKRDNVLKDPRDHFTKFKDKIKKPHTATTVFVLSGAVLLHPWFRYFADVLFLYNLLYFIWFVFFSRTYKLPYKMPKSAKRKDPHDRSRMADGILYIGNEEKTSEEIWFTNSDARTHILYLGTTGAGKTEGLKSMVANALGWGSGFIYVDGKADTDLWGSISALARRYGRDDDLLVLNYMTGNSDARVASNTINPFAQGSASYLTNMLVSLMPDVQGDNAMWKDRAVALIAALMPVLTWQRTYQEKVLNINTIRESLIFRRVIELSRAPEVPERLRKGLKGYLDTLPGYVDDAFNDDGTEKPSQKGPPIDYGTVYQQHGYLAMQFTRQLQSLSDDYGYIFETPSADIDMMDVVLNRRIVVVLIPALEKSADETANLGKIVGSMLKGMMGSTLGSTVEGDTDMALENKPTRSSTPFMAVFDEVGYYTTQGMAVMAAQARSLGFCLVFAGQDLPAMEKRVKEEARSIVANCNLKIFGKLEDPTQTKEFFEKTVGEATVIESSTRKQIKFMFGMKGFDDTDNYNITSRAKANYDQLKSFKEGQAIISFGDRVVEARIFYSNVGKIKSLRVNRFITVPHPDPENKRASKDVEAILERMRDRKWTAKTATASMSVPPDDLMRLVHEIDLAKLERYPVNDRYCAAVTRLGYGLGILQPADGGSAPAPAKSQTGQPKPVEKPQVSSPAPSLSAPQDERMDATPSMPQPQTQPAAQEPVAATPSTEGTLTWGALVGDEDDSAARDDTRTTQHPTASMPEPLPVRDTLTDKAEARGVDLESGPSLADSVSWKELLGEGESDAGDDRNGGTSEQAAVPQAQQGQLDLGGFGQYGSGFGAIGGLGGIGFPAAGRYGGIAMPAGPALSPDMLPEQGNSEDNASGTKPEDIAKRVEEGDTVNWEDLLK